MKYERPLVEYLEELKPTLKWLLSNFEDLRQTVMCLNEEGSTLKDFDISTFLGSSESHSSKVESQIISIITCANIIQSVEQSIYSFRSDNFDIYIKNFQDGITLPAIEKETGIPIRTISRRINYIYQYVLLGLDEDEITFHNLYWFRSKFHRINRLKNVC